MDSFIELALLFSITILLGVIVSNSNPTKTRKINKNPPVYWCTFVNNSHKAVIILDDVKLNIKEQSTYTIDCMSEILYISTPNGTSECWNGTRRSFTFNEVHVQIEYNVINDETNSIPVTITISTDTYWNVKINRVKYDKQIALMLFRGNAVKNPEDVVSGVMEIITPKSEQINFRTTKKGMTLDRVYYKVNRVSFNEVKVTISSHPIIKISSKPKQPLI